MNDDIYYCQSQGLLDASMLEMLANGNKVGEIVLAPSFLIKDLWEVSSNPDDALHNFNTFFRLSQANLSEQGDPKGAFQPSNWKITHENLENEQDRTDLSNISFYFILRWLKYEQTRLKQKQACSEDSLLSCIINPKSTVPKLQRVDEMLAWCYFNYLESNHFLGVDKTYLYGELLQ